MPRYHNDTERALAEALPYRVLAFYILGVIKDSQSEASRHRAWCRSHGLVGRVWICHTGINVQVSGSTGDCQDYARFVVARCASRSTQGQVLCRLDPVPELAFPRLRVKAKKLVSLGVDLDDDLNLDDRGEDLEPEAWAAHLRNLGEKGNPGRLLDLRNSYEWEIGRFAGARQPPGGEFAEATPERYGLTDADKDSPLLLYCTGGIRCEFFGAALRQQGFRKVFKLKGGIQHYGNEVGAEGWQGRLFVFDRRNTVPVGAEGEAAAAEGSRCPSCGGGDTGEFYNCANIDCNRRVVTCARCFEALEGCCCAVCVRVSWRRPLPPPGGSADAQRKLSWVQGPAPGSPDPNRPSHWDRQELDAEDV